MVPSGERRKKIPLKSMRQGGRAMISNLCASAICNPEGPDYGAFSVSAVRKTSADVARIGECQAEGCPRDFLQHP